jgi:hypothetical protein
MNTTQTFPKKYGAVQLLSGLGIVLLLAFWVVGSMVISVMGLTGALVLLGLPFGVALLMYLWSFPKAGIWLSLIMGFLLSGISRYINAPWGLSIDIFLTLSLLVVLINKAIRIRWSDARTDLVIFSLVWMGYLVLEIFNPAGNGFEAWFYAMRGIGFYQALAVPMVYLLFREERDFHTFLNLLLGFPCWGQCGDSDSRSLG